jgi:superfamily II DNA or RNA helicase
MTKRRQLIPDCDSSLGSGVTLRDHQARVVRFMRRSSRKGLIVYHGVGSGKTVTAAGVIKCLLSCDNISTIQHNNNTNNTNGTSKLVVTKAIVLVPVSVQKQWEQSMSKLLGPSITNKVTIGTHHKWLRDFQDNEVDARGALLVVDEAHAFRTEIKHHSEKKSEGKMAESLLDACSQASKVLFLTGTPIVNYASDLKNMLMAIEGHRKAHKNFNNNNNPKSSPSYYPDSYSVLDHRDQGHTQLVQRNKESVKRLLTCRFSMFMDTPENVPKVVEHRYEVPMTPEYLAAYQKVEARVLEAVGVTKNPLEISGLDPYVMGMFKKHIGPLRMACQAIIDDDNNKVSVISPKISWILEHVAEWASKNEKVLVYSAWRDSGVDLIAKYLDDMSIPFRTINGSTSKAKRMEAAGAFNAGTGGVRVLLITAAGSEGIDLKGTRHVVIIEPYWNMTRVTQTIGRAARMGSHESLPKEERNVRVHKLILTKGSRDMLPTADEIIERHAEDKDTSARSVYDPIIAEVSIERMMGENGNGCNLPTTTMNTNADSKILIIKKTNNTKQNHDTMQHVAKGAKTGFHKKLEIMNGESDLCKKWKMNPLVQPFSGNTIHPNGKKYKALLAKCGPPNIF